MLPIAALINFINFIDENTLEIERPNVVAVFEDKLIIATDSKYQQVHIYSKDFKEKIHSFNMKGDEPMPRGMATNGEHIFIADRSTYCVQKYTMDGKFVHESTKSFNGCCGIAIYEEKIYVAHQTGDKIEVLDLNLKPIPNSCIVKQFNEPRDMAIASNGTIYVSDYKNYCIKKFKNGKLKSKFVTKPDYPHGICIYEGENKEYILVASHFKSCILVFKSSGILVAHIAFDKVKELYGIDVDSDGNVYVPNFDGNLVKKFKLQDYLEL